METERDNVKRKIAALLNKTQDAGATEQEAMAAAAKAAELMAVYDIQATELDFKSRSCKMEKVQFKNYANTQIGGWFARDIARLCDVKYWGDPSNNQYVFFGYAQDAEVAAYLYDTLSTAVLAEFADYKQTDEYREQVAQSHHRTVSSAFINAMETRIAERLRAMGREKRETVKQATGTDLVVVKEAAIKEEFKDLGIKLVSSGSSSRGCGRGSYGAHEAGYAAGGRIGINKGVGGESTRGALQ